MNFEKWQALGNDYLIVEADALPFELTPPRIRKLCDRHFGPGSDGVLVLSRSDRPGIVARLRIFNPDGGEAELSGNGVREAVLYMRRRGWVDADTDSFGVETVAGEIRPTITGPTTCTVDMGHARLSSDDYPGGGADGVGELRADGRAWRFQHVKIGNPQCSIRVADLDALQGLDLPAIGPAIERNVIFPNRTNVSWYTPITDHRIRARIFERGVGEDLASGTGATGAAVAHVMAGGASPVTVVLDGGELEVEVGADLHINLSGWALPVIRGTIAEELMEDLRATE